jgi:hypothetical protein
MIDLTGCFLFSVCAGISTVAVGALFLKSDKRAGAKSQPETQSDPPADKTPTILVALDDAAEELTPSGTFVIEEETKVSKWISPTPRIISVHSDITKSEGSIVPASPREVLNEFNTSTKPTIDILEQLFRNR